jgi:FMN phosphatase YigB (HAD superfamily)
MPEKYKTLILFDVGAVLIKINYTRFYRAASRLVKMEPEEFKKAYIDSGIEGKLSRGEIKYEQYFSWYKQIGQLPDDYTMEKHKAYIHGNIFDGPIEENITLKNKLANEGFAVGLFSNITDAAVVYINTNFPEMLRVYKRNNPKIFSYQVGAMKNEDKMFIKITSWEKVIYIDDNIKYINIGIKDFGWYGIWFTPFIDKQEAARTLGDTAKELKNNYTRADTFEELATALNKLGIEF